VNLLAVNFHYIEEGLSHPYPAVYPVEPDRLEAQLVELGAWFDFVSGEQLLAALEGESLPRRACVITFDDGLRSQYENALPILNRLGVPALFFVPCRPQQEGRALNVYIPSGEVGSIPIANRRLAAASSVMAPIFDPMSRIDRSCSFSSWRTNSHRSSTPPARLVW